MQYAQILKSSTKVAHGIRPSLAEGPIIPTRTFANWADFATVTVNALLRTSQN